MFTVGKKNFQDSPGILQKQGSLNEEPDYEQLILKLPQTCFECESVNNDNYKLFIVDNAVVFPDNVIFVENFAFDHIPELIYFIYGKNVKTIGYSAFHENMNL